MNEKNFSENVIIIDDDFVDKVAFDLIVNFERMIGRHIPQADMPRWTECIAALASAAYRPDSLSGSLLT